MIDPNQQSIDPEKEITFTSGGTEANYLAMYSAIMSYNFWGKNKREKNDDTTTKEKEIPHIITTNIEHVATDLPLRMWERDGKNILGGVKNF